MKFKSRVQRAPVGFVQALQERSKLFTYARTLWHAFWMWEFFPMGGYTTGKGKYHHRIPNSEPPNPPLQVNATVKTNWDLSTTMSKNMGQHTDIDFASLWPAYKPQYKIWVYNVSRLDISIDNPVLGQITIPGNSTRKRYIMWTSFPDLMKLPSQKFDDNGILEISAVMCRGEYFVRDLIHPDGNLFVHDKSVSPLPFKKTTAISRDLGQKGVFWSVNNPPKKSEVDAAIAVMQAYYSDLLEKAHFLFEATRVTSKRVTELMIADGCTMEKALSQLQTSKTIFDTTPEMHAAAAYFKVTTPWHPVNPKVSLSTSK